MTLAISQIPAVSEAIHVGPRVILRGEGLALLGAASAAYAHADFSWPMFAALFLAPDLTFAAYAFGPKAGAAAYNALHSTLLPLVLGALSVAFQWPLGEALALIGLAHVGFDRVMGYGLKYATSFNDTHLGRIGRAKS